MASEFFELPDGKAVCFNPEGRFHGWLFYRHPDGQLVSERKLEPAQNPYGPFQMWADDEQERA